MKKIFLLLSIILLTSLSATAEELYAVLSNNNRTLTIYYDGSRVQRLGGLISEVNNSQTTLPWSNYAANITKVCFDPSMTNFTFSNYNNTGTAYWFHGFTNLTSIEGLEYLNTENAKSMQNMFYGCTSLTRLDLSTFRTPEVRYLSYMFEGCTSLTTVDISNFDTTNLYEAVNMFKNCSNLHTIYNNCPKFGGGPNSHSSNYNYPMFEGCVNLVGGSGFAYSPNCVTISYANPGKNGYFTMLPFVRLSQGTLTFYCNTYKYDNGYTLNKYVMDLKPFDSMESRGWNDRRTNITKVVFHESMANCHTITSTAYWLAGMTNLTTIEGLEYLNTENVTSMQNMFYGCTSLTRLDLSTFRTPEVRYLSYMFEGCTSLTTVDISNFDTTNLYEAVNMFKNCSNLHTIYNNCPKFGGGPNSHSSNYNYPMFEGCVNLVGGSGFAYSPNCVTISYANPGKNGYFTMLPFVRLSQGTLTFYCNTYKYDNGYTLNKYVMDLKPFDSMESRGWNDRRTNITKVVFHESMANCHTITSTAYWLAGMTNLNSMEGLHYLNTENVTDMKYMFADCQSIITTIDLRSFNTANVSDMEKMFYNCNKLKTIYCNDSWTPQNSSDMFKGCNQLVGGEGFTYSNNCITAEYANPGKQGYFTKDKPYAWLSNDNKTLTFYYGAKPANGLDVGPFTSASRRAWHENDVLITKVEFDKSIENCTSITSTAYWFSGLFNLTEIEGLKYLNTENVTDMKYMFNDCKNLTSIELNGFKTAKVTDMSYMFNNCQTLESLDVSDFKTEEVTNMQNMFCNVRNLTSLDVSGFNTAKVTNMNNMFCNVRDLTSLDVSGFNTAKVTNMDGMFSGCGVRTIYCDDDWYNPNIFSSDYMFDECWNLVGGSGFSFDEDYVTVKYANPGEQGYFTRKCYMKGDVNGDGRVTPADAIMILYHYFNVNQNGFKIQAADLNGDGNITPADAIETLYKYFGNGNHNARATRPTTSDSRNPE